MGEGPLLHGIVSRWDKLKVGFCYVLDKLYCGMGEDGGMEVGVRGLVREYHEACEGCLRAGG